jgi:hypothetical protein
MHSEVLELATQTRNGEYLLTGFDSDLWNGPAPNRLRDNYRTIGDVTNWRVWQDHLAKRKRPHEIASKFAGRKSPLRWAIPNEAAFAPTFKLLDQLERIVQGRKAKYSVAELAGTVEHWIWSSELFECPAAVAIEAVAWSHALPRLAAILSAPQWWKLLF